MTGRCPHLGLEGERHQVILVSSPRNRCYVTGRAERVGGVFQSEKCLTSAYRRCPRLLVAPPDGAIPGARLDHAAVATGEGQWQEAGVQAGDEGRRTDLKPLRAAEQGRARRSMSPIEWTVLGLGVSIALACVFIGYIFVHRLRVGPGMGAGPALAEGPESVTGEALPDLVAAVSATAPPISATVAVPSGGPTPIPEPTLPAPGPIARPPATHPPTRLVIPTINLDIPVLPVGTRTIYEGGKRKTVWADVPHAGGFHQTSAYPGNPGNTVINGHRDMLGSVFRYLDRLGVGDEITLYVDQVAYPYLVTEILVVPETFASAAQRSENLRLIGYMPEERLTLVTCTPVGLATHRLLVIAKPPEQVAPRMPEAGTGAGP
jgi:sortase A